MDYTTLIAALAGLGTGLGAFAKAFFDARKANARNEACEDSLHRQQNQIQDLQTKAATSASTIEAQRQQIAMLEGSLNTVVNLLGRNIHV